MQAWAAPSSSRLRRSTGTAIASTATSARRASSAAASSPISPTAKHRSFAPNAEGPKWSANRKLRRKFGFDPCESLKNQKSGNGTKTGSYVEKGDSHPPAAARFVQRFVFFSWKREACLQNCAVFIWVIYIYAVIFLCRFCFSHYVYKFKVVWNKTTTKIVKNGK